jgi:hypothetical protein
VIAHEVVHALVPALPHGHGLMSGTLSRQQLTAASVQIDGEVVLAVQAALRGDPVLATSGAAVPAADARVPEKGR